MALLGCTGNTKGKHKSLVRKNTHTCELANHHLLKANYATKKINSAFAGGGRAAKTWPLKTALTTVKTKTICCKAIPFSSVIYAH